MNKLLLACALLFTSNAHALTSFVAGYMLGGSSSGGTVSSPVTQQTFMAKPGHELITCYQDEYQPNKCEVNSRFSVIRAEYAGRKGFNCIHAWALQLPSHIIIMEVSNYATGAFETTNPEIPWNNMDVISVSVENGRLAIYINDKAVYETMSLTDGSIYIFKE